MSRTAVSRFEFQTAVIFLSAAFSCSSLFAQGFSPDEAVRRMVVADDLQVTLVAAEPTVRQPVCIEFDDRGRLWVIQYLQYPNPAGLQRVSVDRFSRTVYDVIPEPPPRGPRGADRITILEDCDKDGVFESAKDFVSDLNLASGLAFGFGGVFVLQTPYLLFYPDRNGDDVPDGDPEVLVRGFGMEDAHSVANSLTWGPDGWLYGCQGSTVTARIQGIEFQQGVWRYHPLRRRFELFCEGGGNSWGLDFDPLGRLLYSTNHGGYRLLHAVPGGYYWKLFGKHGALHNPHAYGYFDHAPHDVFRGGHVTVGGVVYQADGLPDRFRGTFLAVDTLGHGANWNRIEPNGSTVRTLDGGDLLVGNDTWFAPCDLTIGPDGAAYIADWYDARSAHPDPDADWDRSNGRIYRLSKKGLQPAAMNPPPEFRSLTTARLVALLDHPNQWYVRRARRTLQERRDTEALLPLWTAVQQGREDIPTLERLWTLAVCGGLTESRFHSLLSHPRAVVRQWAVQLLGDERAASDPLAARLATLAESEPDIGVRTRLACTARRLPADQAWPILRSLLQRDEDLVDPYQPLLVWWAIEQHSMTATETLVEWFSQPKTRDQRPLVREFVFLRLLRRYAALGVRKGTPLVGRLLPATQDADLRTRADALVSVEAGLAGSQEGNARRALDVDSTCGSHVESFLKSSDSEPNTAPAETRWATVRLGLRLKIDGASTRVAKTLLDLAASTADRIAAAQLAGAFPDAHTTSRLLHVLSTASEPEELRVAAANALQSVDSPETQAALLAAANGQSSLAVAARKTLLSRREGALSLLKQVETGEIPASDMKPEDWQTIVGQLDEATQQRIVRLWGSISPPTPEERLAEIRRLNNDLRAASGDRDRGKLAFATHCAICHRLHEQGVAVGPDLTHLNRGDRDYMLLQLVDPNAIIRKEYLAYTVTTKDGRVLSGLLGEQTAASVILIGAKAERTTIALDDVAEIRELTASLMPENVLKPLSPQELRDLFAYLQANPSANLSTSK